VWNWTFTQAFLADSVIRSGAVANPLAVRVAAIGGVFDSGKFPNPRSNSEFMQATTRLPRLGLTNLM
jgi:hypothetical protein